MDTQQLEPVIERLRDMGFNSYEAKVYLALLKHHPATGYEVSKESGVPQARAYDTLKTLETNKFVVSLGGKPTQYLPVDPKELLSRWEQSFRGAYDFLKEALPSMSDETIEPIINLRGEDRILKEALDLIRRAKKSICLEIWSEDAERLEDALRDAKSRGVAIKIVGYNDVKLPGIDVFPHGGVTDIEFTMGGRHIILCVDDKEGIVGTIVGSSSKPPMAVQTRNLGIILMMKELIVHDIFLLDVERNLYKEMIAIYGKDLKKLRQKILGDDISTVHHFSFCQA
ncbi:MAG: TrmB family transcriptional regulator [Vampirovibrionales bacterium]|nr:TrmB family transcriptional regulator [Vampirovibrionales bacterium]